MGITDQTTRRSSQWNAPYYSSICPWHSARPSLQRTSPRRESQLIRTLHSSRDGGRHSVSLEISSTVSSNPEVLEALEALEATEEIVEPSGRLGTGPSTRRVLHLLQGGLLWSA